MEKSGPLGPTCVLKLNLQCCKACPLKVRNQLKKIKGVTYINIDTEEGLVTVSGVADVSILIKAIKKVGRNAELCKFEIHSKTENGTDVDGDGDHHSNGSGALGSNNVTTIPRYYQNNQYPQIAMRSGYNNNSDHNYNGGNYFPRPPPPMPQPPHSRPHSYQCVLPHPNNCYQQCPPPPPPPPPSLSQAQMLPPPPPPPSYHGQYMHGGGAGGSLDNNNLVHTFSDMNARACTIM